MTTFLLKVVVPFVLGVVVAAALVHALYRPLVPCGAAWRPGGQVTALYCPARSGVWP